MSKSESHVTPKSHAESPSPTMPTTPIHPCQAFSHPAESGRSARRRRNQGWHRRQPRPRTVNECCLTWWRLSRAPHGQTNTVAAGVPGLGWDAHCHRHACRMPQRSERHGRWALAPFFPPLLLFHRSRPLLNPLPLPYLTRFLSHPILYASAPPHSL
jgi:hypothetical protein